MGPASPIPAKRLNIGPRGRRMHSVDALNSRRGLTLIELVVVVGLLVLLAAIALPTIQLAVEGRRVREAARAMNVYLGAARNRAMATGRSVGVVLQRFATEPGNPYNNLCITLDQVEVPPPYAGPFERVRAQVRSSGTGTAQVQFVNDAMPPEEFPLPPKVMRVGDRIQFNQQGFWYAITGPIDPDEDDLTVVGNLIDLQVRDFNAGHQRMPWSDNWSPPASFEIHRQPALGALAVERTFRTSIAKPLQLPLDAAVDLTFSGGTGSGGTGSRIPPAGFYIPVDAFETNPNPPVAMPPVVIMFSPNGSVDIVHYGRYDRDMDSIVYESIRPTAPIYLLIGKRERIRDDYDVRSPGNLDDLSNLEDPENLWITITPQTGLVRTLENAQVYLDPNRTFTEQIAELIPAARGIAQTVISSGGAGIGGR